MNHMKNLLVKLLLAVCMLGGAGQAGAAQPVSYTHLTLPTIYSV